jgi:hypothetical protein
MVEVELPSAKIRTGEAVIVDVRLDGFIDAGGEDA